MQPAEIPNIPKDELLRMILPPGGVQRFRDWLNHCNDLGCLGGTVFFDVDHNAGSKGSMCGSEWPVNLRHGTVVCARRSPEGSWDWDVACPFEHMASMGFHMFPRWRIPSA